MKVNLKQIGLNINKEIKNGKERNFRTQNKNK